MDYDAEIAKQHDLLERLQRGQQTPPRLRWKESDPEKERIAAERQAREIEASALYFRSRIDQALRTIETLQRDRDHHTRTQRNGGVSVGFTATVYRILIASPGDVGDERRLIPEVIHQWNDLHAADLGAFLQPIMWETHSVPAMGDRPQAIINRQMVGNCDMLIGAFWTRLGSPTGVADSGTVEEIQQLREKGKPVMLYFSTQPVAPETLDFEQFQRLKEFKTACKKEGLIDEYSSLAELSQKINRHLLQTIRGLRDQPPAPPTDGPALAAATSESAAPPPRPAVVRQDLSALLRQYTLEWEAERDCEPLNTDEGKFILKRLGSDLVTILPRLEGTASNFVTTNLESAVRETRRLQQHQTFLDGGASYGHFWYAGNEVLSQVKRALEALDKES